MKILRAYIKTTLVFILTIFIGLICVSIVTVYARIVIEPKMWSEAITLCRASKIGSLVARSDSFDRIHIVFSDFEKGNEEISYMKVDNNGNILVDETTLTSALGSAKLPDVAADSEGNAHIVWTDGRNPPETNTEIYYTKLDNQGNILIEERRLTFNSGISTEPKIMVDSKDNIHIVWSNFEEVNYEIHYLKLDDNGTFLVPTKNLTSPDRKYSRGPAMALDPQNNLHVVWIDNRDTEGEQIHSIYFKKLDNEGNTIVNDREITQQLKDIALYHQAYIPTIGTDSTGSLHILLLDEKPVSLNYMKLGDGAILVNSIKLTTLAMTSLSFDMNSYDKLHVVFSDNREPWSMSLLYADPGFRALYGQDFEFPLFFKDPYYQIFYMKLEGRTERPNWRVLEHSFEDPSWRVLEEKWVTAYAYSSFYPNIIIDSRDVSHLIWAAVRGSNYEIMYKNTAFPASFSIPSIISKLYTRILSFWYLSVMFAPVLFVIQGFFPSLSAIALAIVVMYSVRKLNLFNIKKKIPTLILSDSLALFLVRYFIYDSAFRLSIYPGGVSPFFTACLAYFITLILARIEEWDFVESYIQIAVIWITLDLYFTSCLIAPIIFEPVY